MTNDERQNNRHGLRNAGMVLTAVNKTDPIPHLSIPGISLQSTLSPNHDATRFNRVGRNLIVSIYILTFPGPRHLVSLLLLAVDILVYAA